MLNEELLLTLITGYGVKIRNQVIKEWRDLEKEITPRSLIPDIGEKEKLSIIVSQSQKIKENDKRIELLISSQEQLQSEFDILRKSSEVLEKKPIDTAGITFIRARMHKLHKLPARVVNEVLYSSPYAPKPAGQVRNTHEQAGNATYTVWYTSDVSKLFTRFVEECEFVTKTQAVHPDIDGRFKLEV